MGSVNVTQGSGTTSAGKALKELWRDKVAYAVNKQRGFIQRITDTGDEYIGEGYKIHWPIMPVWASAAYTGAALTFTDANITSSDNTPTIAVSAALIQEDVMKTLPRALEMYGPALAEAVLQKMETDGLGLHASSTGTVGGTSATFSEGDFLTAIGNLATNAGDKFAPGEWFGVYHVGQYKNALSFGNLVSASVRGETNGPAKTGQLRLAYGGDLMFTGNVTDLSPGRANLLFVKPWMWLARKDRPSIRMEWSADALGVKVVASHFYGLAVLLTTLATKHTTA